MERFISVRIDQTDSDSIRLHYDFGPGHEAPPPAPVDVTDVGARLERAETDYYAELPDDPDERARHLDSLAAYGRELYGLIDTPERLLSDFVENTAGEWTVLVLNISVGHKGARFAHLPWELLHDGKTFTVTAPFPVIPVRGLPGRSTAHTPAVRSLRVLFMACAPDLDTASPLDYDAEQGRIWEATRKQAIELEVEESGDLEDLEERIHSHREHTFDVVHLTGHAVHADDEPKFVTEDHMGGPRQVGFRELHQCLAGRVRVLFLSGCRTGEAGHAGDVASLAERLAGHTVPVVLGWGRPVADGMATHAAAVFYEWLARGLSPTSALAKTYAEMNTQVPYWHLLRMFLRGDPPGPLVEPANLRAAPRNRDTIAVAERVPGKAEPIYPDPLRFVGRRREVQRAIRMLHPLGEPRDARPGLVVQGMGGIGKTTLAGRICQRLEDRFHRVTLRLAENYLTESYLRQVLMADGRLADVMEGVGGEPSFLKRLPTAFERFPGNLLFWLDEFETSFRPDTATVGDIRMEDERPVAQSEASRVLTQLVTALGQADRDHRIIITSRYPLGLPCVAEFGTMTLGPPREEDIGRMIDRLHADPSGAPLTRERTDAIRDAAGGNPRLLGDLFRAAHQGIDISDDLLRVRMRDTRDRMIDADLALPLLLKKVSPASRRLLEAAAPYRAPVPAGVLARLTEDSTEHVRELTDKLAALNLLESTRKDGAPRFVVPLIIRARLSLQDDVAERAGLCAAALDAELGNYLYEPDVRRLDETLLQEVCRLALEGRNASLAVDATVALTEIHATYGRYGEASALCYRMLQLAPEHRLYANLAQAESELGHVNDAIRFFEHALTRCPPGTDRERAETLAATAYEFTYNLPQTPQSLRTKQLLESIEVARRIGNVPFVLAFALRTLADVLSVTGDSGHRAELTALLDEAADVARTIPDGGSQANAVRYSRLCALMMETAEYRLAERELAEILEVCERLGQHRNAVVVMLHAADNWLNLDEVDQAQKLLEKATTRNRYLNSVRVDVSLELLQGRIALFRGHHEVAEDHYLIASRKASDLLDEASELEALRGRVQCRVALGDKTGAARLLQAYLQREEQFRSPTYRVDLLLAAIDQYAVDSESTTDDAARALEMSRKAASLAHAEGLATRELRAWECFCTAADRIGGLIDEREAALRRMLELSPETRVGILVRIGRLLLGAERFAAARPPLEEALPTDDMWQEIEIRGLLAEAARGSRDHRAAVEQLTAVARLRLRDGESAGMVVPPVDTLRELAAVHRADREPALARDRLIEARALARRIPSSETEFEILQELSAIARDCGDEAEALHWEAAAARADLRRLPLRVRMTQDVARFFDSAQGGTAVEETDRVRSRLQEKENWAFPGVRYSVGEDLPDRSYDILVWGEPVHQGQLPLDHVLIPPRPEEERAGRVTIELGLPGVEWLTEEQALGLPVQDPSRVTLADLCVVASRHRETLESYDEPPPPEEPGLEDLTVQQILDRLPAQDAESRP